MALFNHLISAHISTKFPYCLVSFTPGITPLSTAVEVLTTLAGYLAFIFSAKAFMVDRKPYQLTSLFRVHNLFLSFASALLLALMLYEVAPQVWQRGFRHTLCSPQTLTPQLEFYYILNYYFKFIELFDTVFLALKKKPLNFLHVYHHAVTAWFCYLVLHAKLAGAWTAITLNLTVHVFMYYYYYATAGGVRLWWKEYLTVMQIGQFILDLLLVGYAVYEHYAHNYYQHLPHSGDCSLGSLKQFELFALVVFSSYLGLFINFYIQTYKKPPSKKLDAGCNGKDTTTCGTDTLETGWIESATQTILIVDLYIVQFE
ncbi:hypothetical protein NP233_g1778 [Leucocoprinus birnbaumii]|uniref:Elongation of fatty acids protein n=1 Tax=Leucocoprinus birnbaumii TaxID=56174 RepID=A0AAD5W3F4_9AGAR|nr:hypothetical protein NP233_g1778 [Leucocoprinus birnbaumii]